MLLLKIQKKGDYCTKEKESRTSERMPVYQSRVEKTNQCPKRSTFVAFGCDPRYSSGRYMDRTATTVIFFVRVGSFSLKKDAWSQKHPTA